MLLIGIMLVIAALMLALGYIYRKQISLIWQKHSKKIITFALASSIATGSLIGLPPEEEEINPFDSLPSLEKSGFELHEESKSIHLKEKDNINSLAEISKEKASAKLISNDGHTSITISYSTDKPVLSNIKDNRIHYEYSNYETMIYPVTNEEMMLEFLLILKNKPTNNRISFDIDIGDLIVIDNTIVNPNAKLFNYELFKFETPYIVDSDGNKVEGKLRLTNDELIITIPQKFLDSAKYPIYIDPTVTWSDHFIDGDNYLQFDIKGIDLDEDGDTDVVCTDYERTTWFENDGSEGWTEHAVNTRAGGLHNVVIDLDEDGDLDIVTSDLGDGVVAWFENDGSESFTRHIIDSGLSSGSGAGGIDVDDLDDDGDLDIVSGDANDFMWYENDGSESFTENSILNDPNDCYPYGMQIVDLDEDGDKDIVTPTNIDAEYDLAWFKNDGSESFTITPIEVGNGDFDTWFDPHVVDIDHDGDLDIGILEGNSNYLVWMENDGSESFTVHNIDTSSVTSYFCDVGDIDGDGEYDFTTTAVGADEVRVWINDGSESFTETVIGTRSAPYSVNISDVNSDSHMDILMGRYTDCRWYEQIPPNLVSTNTTNGTCFNSANLSGYNNWPAIVGFEWGLTDSYGYSYNLTRAECWEVDTSAEWTSDGTFSNTEMWTNDGVLNGNLVLEDVSMGAWTNYFNSGTYDAELGKPYEFVVQKANADLSGHDEARVGSYIKSGNVAYACTARETFENHSSEYQSTASTSYVWIYDSIPSIYLGDVNWYIKGYYSAIFGSYWGYMDGERLQYQDVSDYQDSGYWLSNWQSFPDDFLPVNVTSDIDAVDGGIINITLESSQDGAAVDESESFTNLPLGVNINETTISKAPYFRLNVSLEEGTDTPQVNYVKLCGYNLTNGTFNHTITGLDNCTTYHYRAILNDSGTIYTGDDMTFTTHCTPYISSINITDNSIIGYTQPEIQITVIDNDNATMNITWYESVNCSIYVEDQVNNSIANNTNASWTYTNASTSGNTYCFKVVIDDYGCGGVIEYYYSFDITEENKVNITNDGKDYFCWKGENCTLSDVAENITGMDNEGEFVAVWNASSWTTDEGCWIKYYGDGNGTDANVNQLDVIYVYLQDSGYQVITMNAADVMPCARTEEIRDLGDDINKGYNYTCYCCDLSAGGVSLEDIGDNIGLQEGEVVSWWNNTSKTWYAWIEGISHSDYDIEIDSTCPIFETKVSHNYSWVVSCP